MSRHHKSDPEWLLKRAAEATPDKPFIGGEATVSAIHDVLATLTFYRDRCNELQRVQPHFRDPERQAVCDILANGYTTVEFLP